MADRPEAWHGNQARVSVDITGMQYSPAFLRNGWLWYGRDAVIACRPGQYTQDGPTTTD